jgi:hypothetical protein
LSELRWRRYARRREAGFLLRAAAPLSLAATFGILVFKVADPVLLGTLPYPEPDRLVLLRSYDRASRAPVMAVPADVVAVVREHHSAVDDVAILGTPDLAYLAAQPHAGTTRSVRLVARMRPGRATPEDVIGHAIYSVVPAAQLRIGSASALRDRSVRQPSLEWSLFSMFAALAVLVVALGIYARQSYIARLHVHETSVRLALGGTPGAVYRLMVGRMLRPVAAGIVLGMLLHAWLIRTVLKPAAEAAVDLSVGYTLAPIALLLATAVLAAHRPLRLAATVDPAALLRTN